MRLALFDLDNTLIDGDSDHLWGEFVIKKGLVEEAFYREKNDQFYQDYQNGILDMVAYQQFCLTPLSQWDMATLHQFHAEFMEQFIYPIIKPKSLDLIDSHRQQGDQLIVITATNRFITAPIVKHLGIEALIATEPKIAHGRMTGEITHPPCYQEGKITLLERWLEARDEPYSIEQSTFYSDSFNDLPLLYKVAHPIVVDGDDRLLGVAKQKGWQTISLRH